MECIKPFSIEVLQKLINRYLKLDMRLQQHLHPLVDKYFLVEITGVDLTFHIFFNTDSIAIDFVAPAAKSPDLIICGSPTALWRLFRSDESTFQLCLRDVKVSGDLNFAHAIQIFFKAIDIDWEEQFSHVVGDVLAHELFRGFSAVQQWGQVLSENFKLNLTEYLQEEVRYFPVLDEVKEFEEEVDMLRDDVERLEARIERLAVYEQF